MDSFRVGTIIKAISGFYYVVCDGKVHECKARGKFKKLGISPMVGDVVEFSQNTVTNVLPRRNHIIRPKVANVEQMIIVIATCAPNPDFYLIDQLIVMCLFLDVKPILCFNKADLSSTDELRQIYKVFDCIDCCAEENDLGNLIEILQGKTSVFAGNSGVGKSTILQNLGLDTPKGDISKINRGKHTTRVVELFPLDNSIFAQPLHTDNPSFVIDTPGFSVLTLEHLKSDILQANLADYFPEFQDFSCEFRGCLHDNPRCDIYRAVQDKIIPQTRYNSYLKILDSLEVTYD
ncbi:MAG: ribosome small subunit-dependent GTPase A [Clostridiales bacterium]|jgi:ribosome biogenesis GTPase|nr:ribosome small subunit-dependent GTPase A [Clostridiales bacterium]